MIFKKNKPVDYEEQIVESFVYSEEQLMARLKFFIGICLTLTLFGIVFVVLYSLIFVTQPLNAISPIDQKFFELIVPIATFLTGTLSGIMLAGNSKEDKEAMLSAHKTANENFEATKKMMAAPPPLPPVQSYNNTSQFTGSYGGNTNQFTTTPNFTPGVVMSSTGKPMPIQPPQPEL